ncbi:hypothetical protein CEXT_715931 [Caerostris extrusa]|uniref:Ycf15 n=1 Tax=Caerostris extrusa TaxID=172846 RepID=A0AAV4NUP5_CAEEX|nr:hypothetical protein CEXT_715931 [Caerostris extrusa]
MNGPNITIVSIYRPPVGRILISGSDKFSHSRVILLGGSTPSTRHGILNLTSLQVESQKFNHSSSSVSKLFLNFL